MLAGPCESLAGLRMKDDRSMDNGANAIVQMTPGAAGGPLRVLLVCEDIPGTTLGGLARHVVALGNALIDAGHAVTLMGRQPPTPAIQAEPTGFRGPFFAGFTDPMRGWKEHATGAFNPFKRPYYARRIAAAIVADAPGFDVVHYHGHLPMVGRYVPAHIRFVQTRHDQGSECITHLRFRNGAVCQATDARVCASCIHPAPGPLRTAISAAAVRRYRRDVAQAFTAHPVVFVSQFLLDNYRRAVPAVPGLQAHVVHNFVDDVGLQHAAAAAPRERAAGRLVVHVAGRIEPAKGIAAFLRLLLPRMPAHWQVQVYGDGPDRAALAALGDGRLMLHGHQPLDVVVRAAVSADIGVVPSVCEESCSTVVMELLRLGKPCYAVHRGGTPELARYGGPGQLRLFDDLPALVDGLVAETAPTETGTDTRGLSASVQVQLPALLALYRQPALAA